MNRATRITLPLLLALVIPVMASAAGLRCSVGEVVLENLKISKTYSLRTLANLPLTLTNTADHAVTVALDPLVPGESELRGGAEAIGSASWVSVVPETLTLQAGQTGTADVSIAVPDDEALFGRRFQAIVWSHTLPDPNDLISVGLKSRIIFSVDTERDTGATLPTGELGIELESAELRLSNLKPRRTYPLEQLMTRPMTVRNTSARTLTIELAPAAVPASEASEAGDLLAVAKLRFDPASHRACARRTACRDRNAHRGRSRAVAWSPAALRGFGVGDRPGRPYEDSLADRRRRALRWHCVARCA